MFNIETCFSALGSRGLFKFLQEDMYPLLIVCLSPLKKHVAPPELNRHGGCRIPTNMTHLRRSEPCNDIIFLQSYRVYDAQNHYANHSSPTSGNFEPRSGAMFVAKSIDHGFRSPVGAICL